MACMWKSTISRKLSFSSISEVIFSAQGTQATINRLVNKGFGEHYCYCMYIHYRTFDLALIFKIILS